MQLSVSCVCCKSYVFIYGNAKQPIWVSSCQARWCLHQCLPLPCPSEIFWDWQALYKKGKNVNDESWDAIMNDMKQTQQNMYLSLSASSLPGASSLPELTYQPGPSKQTAALTIFDETVAPHKQQWDHVEKLMKLLVKSDSEASKIYAEMAEWHKPENPASRPSQTAVRILREMEDLCLMNHLYSVRAGKHNMNMLERQDKAKWFLKGVFLLDLLVLCIWIVVCVSLPLHEHEKD